LSCKILKGTMKIVPFLFAFLEKNVILYNDIDARPRAEQFLFELDFLATGEVPLRGGFILHNIIKFR